MRSGSYGCSQKLGLQPGDAGRPAGRGHNFRLGPIRYRIVLPVFPLLEGDISWTPAADICDTITSGLYTLKTLIEGD